MDNFYVVALIKIKAEDGTFNNPVFTQESTSSLAPLDWAKGKFYSALSTYYNDSTWSYVGCYILRSDGVVIQSETVDRRTEA